MDKTQFRNTLKDILNHLGDTAYLENNSLANLLLSEEESRGGNRIQILRNKISESIEVLRPPADIPTHVAEWRCYRILTLRYLRGLDLYVIEDELGLSQRQVQRVSGRIRRHHASGDVGLHDLRHRRLDRQERKPSDEFETVTAVRVVAPLEFIDHRRARHQVMSVRGCTPPRPGPFAARDQVRIGACLEVEARDTGLDVDDASGHD